MAKKIFILLFFLSVLGYVSNGQFPKRQLAIYVIPKPQKTIFKAGEPILIDVEIKNQLKHEIRLTAFAFSPNEWNGETGHIELPDIYRLPEIVQIWVARPGGGKNFPRGIAAPGWHSIPAKSSKVSTIDVSKWQVVGGWTPGKYQLLVRVNKIDVDRYSWVNVTSDPITFEIQ
ncbi:MAG: hypothetical protein JST84_10615 [Acidobacteria bacterium]|nr:hypothetical protein [Acidobacteriota bacterium]